MGLPRERIDVCQAEDVSDQQDHENRKQHTDNAGAGRHLVKLVSHLLGFLIGQGGDTLFDIGRIDTLQLQLLADIVTASTLWMRSRASCVCWLASTSLVEAIETAVAALALAVPRVRQTIRAVHSSRRSVRVIAASL